MIDFRLPRTLDATIRADIGRTHPFAYERVGFVICKSGRIGAHDMAILGADYLPVNDDEYIPSDEVGALIGRSAIRRALERAYFDQASVFHVHCHDHSGYPGFSRVDLDGGDRLIPDFWKASANVPHGLLLMSHDRAIARVWISPDTKPVYADRVTVVGWPTQIFRRSRS